MHSNTRLFYSINHPICHKIIYIHDIDIEQNNNKTIWLPEFKIDLAVSFLSYSTILPFLCNTAVGFGRAYSNFSAIKFKEVVNCGRFTTIQLGISKIEIYNIYLAFY